MENNISGNKVSDFYDTFSRSQIKTGINLRHYYLFHRLMKEGLKPGSSVLEIGCGIGTLSYLTATYLRKGELVITDISPENISIAGKRLSGFRNVSCIVSDMSDFDAGRKFDFIILADVIEHIPIEMHQNLFDVISKHMHDGSVLFMNYPHPKSIEYYRSHDPSKLQIIDQAIYPGHLIPLAEKCGLLLKNYKSYSLFHMSNDYISAVFTVPNDVDYKPVKKINIIFRKLIYRVLYYLKTLF